MAAHILGYRGVEACKNASKEAKKAARAQQAAEAEKKHAAAASKKRKSHPCDDDRSDGDDVSPPAKRQQTLKAYRSVDMPFSAEQIEAIQEQACKAIVSTGSAFGLFEDPEMLKLLWMFRTLAEEALPSGKVV
jgi:hypothetical protein